LGLGGSTGKATGKHVHLEVRIWDQLANPLDLLPADPEQPALSLDCGAGELALLRGGSANLDFAASLPQGTRITGASVAGGPDGSPVAAVEGDGMVRLTTAPRVGFSGAGDEQEYTLNLTLEGAQRDERTCDIRLATLESSAVPFSEASFAAATSGSPYDTAAPPAQPPAPPANPTEPTPPPAAAEAPPPLLIPTNIPLLGGLTSPTPSPTPTQTLVPTQTPVPTDTPAPIRTPPPTPTTQPSPTPAAPSPTPSPTATSKPS
jgi:hypothetical protein